MYLLVQTNNKHQKMETSKNFSNIIIKSDSTKVFLCDGKIIIGIGALAEYLDYTVYWLGQKLIKNEPNKEIKIGKRTIIIL